MSEKVNKFAYADRISDRIVAMVNEEMADPDLSPVQMMAGQMLGLMALLRTAPRGSMPPELRLVRQAVQDCLKSLFTEGDAA